MNHFPGVSNQTIYHFLCLSLAFITAFIVYLRKHNTKKKEEGYTRIYDDEHGWQFSGSESFNT